MCWNTTGKLKGKLENVWQNLWCTHMATWPYVLSLLMAQKHLANAFRQSPTVEESIIQ